MSTTEYAFSTSMRELLKERQHFERIYEAFILKELQFNDRFPPDSLLKKFSQPERVPPPSLEQKNLLAKVFSYRNGEYLFLHVGTQLHKYSLWSEAPGSDKLVEIICHKDDNKPAMYKNACEQRCMSQTIAQISSFSRGDC